jgi:hypothetical protein
MSEARVGPAREIVDRDHLVALREEAIDEMRADETGPANDEYALHVSEGCSGYATNDQQADSRVRISLF